MASLRNEVLKVSQIREVAQREIAKALEQVVSSGDRQKQIVIDPSLTPFMRYSGVTTKLFQDPKQEIKGVMELRSDPKHVKIRNYVYFVRPEPETMRVLNSHVTAIINANPRTSIFIYFFPKKTLLCEHILENEYQILTKVQHLMFGELDIDLLPLDDDVLSMEYGRCFKSLFIDGDQSVLHWAANSIVKLQAAFFGQFPVIRSKGKYATKVLNIVKRLQENEASGLIKDQAPEIEALYIVDRATDLLTPMLTQLTYEGSLDEIWGIETGSFDPPFDLHKGTERTEERERAIQLNSDDEMYASIRDRSITKVGKYINKRGKDVQSDISKKDELGKQGTAEVYVFVKKMPHLLELKRLISIHTNILEAIQNAQDRFFRKQIHIEQSILLMTEEKEVLAFVEDKINKGDSVESVLRMLCMMSITQGGLKPALYESIKDMLMLGYGIPQMHVALTHFEKCGLLTKQASSSGAAGIAARLGQNSQYAQLKSKLNLWDDELNEDSPKDYSYAYSGYAPLLTRTVEALLNSPNGANSPELDAIPGESGELYTDVEVAGNVRLSMIYVVGGVTLAEMSTLRFLAQKLSSDGESRQFIIATTNITSGNKIVSGVLPFDTD